MTTTHVVSATRSIAVSAASPIVGHRVELQLLTTLKCNLKCTYCSLGVGNVLGSQTEIAYDLDQLAAFIDKHLRGKEIYVTFYGGEPTLNRRMMEDVMRRFPEFRFQLQTNGTLLDDLPDWMLAKLSNILVSIDGGEAITDGYRGRGIWRQVIDNLHKVHDKVGGTITARVTWSNPDTTFEELDELATAFDAIDYVYWQFVADEMYAGDSVAKRKAVLTKLIDKFFSSSEELYPF
ncbi:MAG: radical SAM protein, partial [Rhodocyclaceae bacterium]